MPRQLCLGRFPPIAEQHLQVLVPLGLDRWCRLVGVTPPCSTGAVLFCRQGVGGFGTDPQMTAVPSIASSVCFHLKGSRRNCSLHPGLPPFSLPCPYCLNTNGVAYTKSLQVSAPRWCSERSSVHFQLGVSRWVNVSRYQLGLSSRHHWFCSPSKQSLGWSSIQALGGSAAEIKQSDIWVFSRALTLPQYPLRNFHSCFRSTIRLTVARADCFMCETPVPSECLEWGWDVLSGIVANQSVRGAMPCEVGFQFLYDSRWSYVVEFVQLKELW